MIELYKTIRDDLVNEMYDKNIPLEDIADYLDISLDDLVKYLKLEKTDYLVYKNITIPILVFSITNTNEYCNTQF